MQRVDEASFEQEVLKSGLPVVVDFYADWCGPCKRMEPILEKVSNEHSGKVKVVKMNSEDNAQVASTYSVRGLPTLIMFLNGEEVDRKLGFQSEQELSKFLASV
jgi:thioredoxin 1